MNFLKYIRTKKCSNSIWLNRARKGHVRAAGSSTHRGTQNTDENEKAYKRELWQVDKRHEKKILEGSMPGT